MRPRPRYAVPAVALACTAISTLANALPVAIEIPTDTPCSSAEEFARLLQVSLDDIELSPESTALVVVTVTVTHTVDGYEARLSFGDTHGAVERTVVGQTCHSAVEALAFSAAVALEDSQAVKTYREQEQPAAVPEAVVDAPFPTVVRQPFEDQPPAAVSLLPETTPSWGVSLLGGGWVAVGSGRPDLTGAEVGATLRPPASPLTFELGVRYGTGRVSTFAGDAEFQAWFTELGLGYAFDGGLAPRVLLEVGSVRGEGTQTLEAAAVTRLWLAAGLGLQAQLAVGGGLRLAASGAVIQPIANSRFFFGPDVAVFDTNTPGFSGGLSLLIPLSLASDRQ